MPRGRVLRAPSSRRFRFAGRGTILIRQRSGCRVGATDRDGRRWDMPDSAPNAARLKLHFLSHGTLESKDLEASRKFYEEVLGHEVVRTSPISLLLRLGRANTIAVV